MTGASPSVAAALEEYVASSPALGVAELDETATIIVANELLVGLAGGPLAGRRVHEIVAAAQRQTLDEALAEPGGGWQQRLLGLFPDARSIPLDFTVSLRRLRRGWLLVAEPAATIVGVVSEQLTVLNDELAQAQGQIRRQNDELGRQNEQLRELDQLKDTLLANVSHDLRTPLAAILGYAELLHRRGNLNAQQAQATEVIGRNARRLLGLVNGLLLLGQARAGQLTLNSEPVRLSDLAAEAVELAGPLADQAGLRLRLDRSGGETPINGDRLRLSQLLDNLIANAIKFTPQGGAVTIRVRSTEESAAVEVQDTGPGIPEPERARLYEPFARGASTAVPGSGLGLAIVRTVADAHGAAIELDTGPDRGTRFVVHFPRAGGATLSRSRDARPVHPPHP